MYCDYIVRRKVLCLIALSVHFFQLSAAVFYVSIEGNDSAGGTASEPWRTIGQGISEAEEGDTVIVRQGDYDERVTTMRSGSDAARITFQAEGKVVMKGWVIDHSFITVRGFDITGHSAPHSAEAYVKVNDGANFFHMQDCSIRDGIAFTGELEFIPPNRIVAPAGGFIPAGFYPGQSISILKGTNISILNQGDYIIDSVNDSEIITDTSSLLADGPKAAYISGSPNYGLYLSAETEDALVLSNRFENLEYNYCFIMGRGHLLEGNTFERSSGWNIVQFGGSDHVFRGNHFRNGGWGLVEPSPDVFENRGSNYERIHFTNNFVQSFIGLINAQKKNDSISGPLWITRNVFIDVGPFLVRCPNTTIAHNTFLRVARHHNKVVQLENHVIVLATDDNATNAVIRNNIFVDCGEARFNQTESDVGWYEIIGPGDSVLAEGNFCAGQPPAFEAKADWPEENELLNGGDPGFVDIEDPLGPDGLPFTADDGLRLVSSSKLIGQGAGGAAPGAYAPVSNRTALTIERIGDDSIRIRWEYSTESGILETSDRASGPWAAAAVEPSVINNFYEVVVQLSGSARFFRLRQ